MKEGWTYKKLGDCVIKIPKTRHVKSKDYKSIGKYPIVSQEKEIVSGYWDDEEYLFKHSSPVIIFGDHTKEIKYIDFDFVVGADGTQILQPKDSIVPKFFYYALKMRYNSVQPVILHNNQSYIWQDNSAKTLLLTVYDFR